MPNNLIHSLRKIIESKQLISLHEHFRCCGLQHAECTVLHLVVWLQTDLKKILSTSMLMVLDIIHSCCGKAPLCRFATYGSWLEHVWWAKQQKVAAVYAIIISNLQYVLATNCRYFKAKSSRQDCRTTQIDRLCNIFTLWKLFLPDNTDLMTEMHSHSLRRELSTLQVYQCTVTVKHNENHSLFLIYTLTHRNTAQHKEKWKQEICLAPSHVISEVVVPTVARLCHRQCSTRHCSVSCLTSNKFKV